MKRFFDEDLDHLKSDLILMGQKAIDQVRLALRALVEQDSDLARQVRRKDDELDELEMRIDAEAISYISLRAPVATELRLLIVGMKAGHDLERVGDEANGIAKRAIKLAAEPPVKPDSDIPRMADIAVEMLQGAIDSFLSGDEEKALGVCHRDKEVDRINKQVYRKLSAIMAENPSTISSAIELMFVSKSIERIADHAANIAEEVIFLLRGKDVRHSDLVKPQK